MARPCPIPLSEFDPSTTAHSGTIALPPAAFSDPAFYEFELDAVWGRDWICIGRASDIPAAGDYYTLTIGREPLLVLRQPDGAVRVLANVCRHRGLVLVEGRGTLARIRCPMHAWTYDLGGRLLGAPGYKDDPGFDAARIRLPEIRSELWEGFIFIAFDAAVPPLAPRLERLKRQLANYRLAELRANVPLAMERFAWNWKMYLDECYHCTYLHAESWGRMFPVPPSAVDEETAYNDPGNGIVAYELIGRHPDAAPTRTGKALFPILPGLSERERTRLAYVTLAPNLLIIAMPDKVKYFLWLPSGPTDSQFGVSWLYPAATLADTGFAERWTMEKEDLYPVMIEDLDGWRRYQAGAVSRFAPRGRLSSHEKTFARMQDWLVAKYRAAAAG
jgi:phenylpropionate dioxygenase-like ring-hydroxylating dioxygenase large terminal subunit